MGSEMCIRDRDSEVLPGQEPVLQKSISASIGGSPLLSREMTALDAFHASDGFFLELQTSLNDNFLDVLSDISKPTDCVGHSPQIEVKDYSVCVDKHNGVFGRVVVIDGCTFSPNYYGRMLDQFDSLSFAYSPPKKSV